MSKHRDVDSRITILNITVCNLFPGTASLGVSGRVAMRLGCCPPRRIPPIFVASAGGIHCVLAHQVPEIHRRSFPVEMFGQINMRVY